MSVAVSRIIYTSNAVRLFQQSDLEAILAAARRRNAMADMTGLLLYHEGAFLQVLEGETAALASLMALIRADRRHNSLIQLASEPADSRVFPQWSMGYVQMGELDAHQRAGAFDLFALRNDPAELGRIGRGKSALHARTFLNSFREFEHI